VTLIAINPTGERAPVFCVHPITGHVRSYEAVARALDRPLYALAARGLDGREAPRTTVEEMARAYVDEIRATHPEGPYLLAGWSVGAIIAFEMAQTLSRLGETPACLVVMDAHAPGPELRKQLTTLDEAAIVKIYVLHVTRVSGSVAPIAPPSAFDHETLHRYAHEAALAHGALPASSTLAEREAALAVFGANLRALFSYEPTAYPGRFVLFRTKEGLPDHPRPPTLGWEKHVGDRIEYRSIEGNHFTLASPSHAPTLARELGACFGEQSP
jgi:thioesterase domain-containing protein